MPEIGNLLVSLQVETAQFNKGIADTNKKLDAFGKQFDGISKGITSAAGTIGKAFAAVGLAVGAVAAIKGIASWAKSMSDAGEAVGNLAVALGMSEANIVQLQGVFQLTTGTLEEASGAMRIFIGHIADATAKAGPARESFAAIGISLADLKAKGDQPLEMLKLVADQMLKFNDDTFKAAIGADLFGKAWEKIAPLMKDGADGIESAAKRAAELDPAALAAAAAGDALDKKMDELNKSITGLSNETFVTFQQSISNTIDVINQMIQTGSAIIRWARSVRDGIVETLNSMAQSYEGFKARTFAKITGNINPRTGEPMGPQPLIDKGDIAERRVMTIRPSVDPPGGGGKKKGGGGGGGSDAEARRLEREAERERKRLQRETIEAAEEENKISDELFRRKEQQVKSDVELDKLTKQEGITAERKLLDEKMVATQEFYQKKFAAAVADEDETRKLQNQSKLDYERFLTEREGLNQNAAKIQHDTWKDIFGDLGQSLKSSFESIFESLLNHTFKLKDAIGNLLKDIGKKLASRAFDALLGGGTSSGPGLLTKALGLADLKLFQSGGSFQVGGAGALDSQLVAFRASPGEMVSVNRPGEMRGGAGYVRIDLNPSEGWVAGVADQRIVTRSGQIIEVAVRQSSRTVQRNFAGMSAEAQARQL